MRLNEAESKRVAENMGLVGLHIRRFVGVPKGPTRHCEFEDLFQEGYLALVEAARSYDPVRHGPFGAYALPRIHHAVSVAMYERFATVRVPARTIKRAHQRRRERWGTDRYRPEPALLTTYGLREDSPKPREGDRQKHRPIMPSQNVRLWRGDPLTVQRRLREKYEAAVAAVADRVSGERRGRDDRYELIRRFVNERLLIPDATAQTPKRQLARDFRSSLGRIDSCEGALVSALRALLGADEEFRALLKLARRDEAGMERIIDPSLSAELERLGTEGFTRRLSRLSAEKQAPVLRQLICMTMGSLCDFARRLWLRLDEPKRCVVLDQIVASGQSHASSDPEAAAKATDPEEAPNPPDAS